MLIDIYTHIFPGTFFEQMSKAAPRLENIGKRMQAVVPVHNLEERFRQMDAYGDYKQLISLPNPPLEDIMDAETGTHLARVANDAMAEECAKHPDRFVGFAAALCMLDMDSAMEELHRSIKDLGARGVQIFTNVAGEPLDKPEYLPLFDAMAEYDLPIWMHPARGADMSDYKGEERGRYEMWWCFGWPYETSVAMTRLVYCGMFDRHPDLKIITHHMGGMIPFFDGRVGPGMDVLGARTTDEDLTGVLPALKKPHAEYFKNFYADTAMFGATLGIECGMKYFGVGHTVFSTDFPFAPTAETIEAINSLELERNDLDALCSGNAERLMKL
ncbi:MAG: amidohydrolase family protein [Alphaproteobacteria bacterium]|nr:amidohydrolase family protein [Alphaproteobacteria bacterium]